MFCVRYDVFVVVSGFRGFLVGGCLERLLVISFISCGFRVVRWVV